jgi:predicted RNase H-like HicB family nuclease
MWLWDDAIAESRPVDLFSPKRYMLTEQEHMMGREFYVVIERDEDGLYVGEVLSLAACYSQGETLDELMQNMREVIALSLEDDDISDIALEFVGVQKVTV